VPVGPGDLCSVLVVIFAEKETQDRLEEERVVVDWNVDQRQVAVLELVLHGQHMCRRFRTA
jgi:hypothetical protein